MNTELNPQRTPAVILIIRGSYMLSSALWTLMPLFEDTKAVGDASWTYILLGLGAGLMVLTAPYPKHPDGRPANLSPWRAVSPLMIVAVALFKFIRLVI